jgi:hypothetical protein
LGVYVSLMMVTSAAATLTLIPAFLLLRAPRFLRVGQGHGAVRTASALGSSTVRDL